MATGLMYKNAFNKERLEKMIDVADRNSVGELGGLLISDTSERYSVINLNRGIYIIRNRKSQLSLIPKLSVATTQKKQCIARVLNYRSLEQDVKL